MEALYLAIPLLPGAAALIAGLFGRWIGRIGAHTVCIGAVGLAFVLSVYALHQVTTGAVPVFDEAIYTWMVSDGLRFEIGFLIDRLAVLMMATVTGVSLAVHVFTIGYMDDDPGYQRFFSYIAAFTFFMLMLVMANNFLQLFFGWEGVGLMSYLLIGFWFTRESAIFANLKAFLVNRVGDLGFVLGIGAIVAAVGSLDYAAVFDRSEALASTRIAVFGGTSWSAATVAAVLLFIGAMGKSAQVPLHVWLPDSMEGPTPISALIHAATMVTAGIFMVARLAPIYELAEPALTLILVLGGITALFMGLVGVVQNDIKRVIAYSTISQLGYMAVALGASAYSAAIFHLMTHAFFKALLFLAAGSVIIALHHEQDMRRMGGLWRYMPVTYVTAVIGGLALVGFPGFAGFFSKDVIIEAVAHSHRPGAGFAYICVLLGVGVTALYTTRLIMLTFHGKPRMDEHTREHVHETPLVVTVPLVALAIPSVVIGAWTIDPVVFGDFFAAAMPVHSSHDVIAELGHAFHGWASFISHAFQSPAVYLALGGLIVGGYVWGVQPSIADACVQRLRPVYRALERKFGFDELYQVVFMRGARTIGQGLARVGDVKIIDGWVVNGAARAVGRCSVVMRHLQQGYLYTYAFYMILGVVAALTWVLVR
jgi:NADH-quinone oxidoreductase subunit L